MRHDRARIAGTGITVHRIAILSNLGHGPEEIVRKFKHLTLAGVHAALAYYHANREQVDSEIAADRDEAARLEAEFARSPQVAWCRPASTSMRTRWTTTWCRPSGCAP